jgi:hypothetical protein
MNQEVVERGDADEALDLEKAQQVTQVLCKHYPNHPWLVSFQGKVLVVRHAAISNAVTLKLGVEGFGAVIKHLDSHSAKDLAHSAMQMGGQMLEAFGLPRGAWDGRDPVVPPEWKRKQKTFKP